MEAIMTVFKKPMKIIHTEQQIKSYILHYLDSLPDSFVCNIELSGRPVKTRSGHTILIPFKNKFYRTGMSDILFWKNGKSYAFEVKTPSELKWWLNKIKKNTIDLTKKKDRHFWEQTEFLQEINAAGGKGAFVSSVEMVKSMIENFEKL